MRPNISNEISWVEGYFKRIREICNKYQVLLILDEVMCGMGRTGNLFACEYEEISPDIVAIAKGLGGGYQPIGAMLCSKKIFDTISEGSGFFQHGHTYLGHPVACSAAKAVLNKIIQNKLPERVTLLGEQLINQLRKYKFDKAFIFNSSLRYNLISKFSSIHETYQYPLFQKKKAAYSSNSRRIFKKKTGKKS